MEELEFKTKYGNIDFSCFDIDKEMRISTEGNHNSTNIIYIQRCEVDELVTFLIDQLQKVGEPVTALQNKN